MPQKSCISEIDTTGIATGRIDESALESIDRQHPHSKLHLSEILWILSRSFFNKDYTTGLEWMDFKDGSRKDQLQ